MGGGQSRARANEAAAQYPDVHENMAYVKSYEEYKEMYDRSVKVGAGRALGGRRLVLGRSCHLTPHRSGARTGHPPACPTLHEPSCTSLETGPRRVLARHCGARVRVAGGARAGAPQRKL